MRRLMWFTIGFSLSCGLCAYSGYSPWILPLAFLAAVTLATVAGIRKRRQFLQPALAVLMGCLMGLCWFGASHWYRIRPLQGMDGEQVSLCVTASDYGYDTGYSTAADGVVMMAGKPYQIRLYLREKTEIQPGDRITGVFRMRLTLPDEAEDSAWFQGKGIFLLGYGQEMVSVEPADMMPKWCFPAVLRQKILTILAEIFPADTLPFAKALLLGDGRDLSYAVNTHFKVSGIRHIIAVSGLHISILYALIRLVTLRRRYLTAAVGIPVLFLFAAVAGFTPSVTRACIMVWLMLLSQVFDREYDGLTALAFAVLVMLLVNPLAVTSVSLQLSAGCVAGILLFNAPINRWLQKSIPKGKGIFNKIRAMVCSTVSVSLSASSLITPLCACYFGTVSLIGVLTNLVTLWAVNLIFNGMVLTCLAYVVWPTGAALMGKFLACLIRYVLFTAEMLAKLPLAAVYTKSPYIVIWLVFLYFLLVFFLLTEKKRPGILLCCGTLGLCAALMASWLEPLTSDTRITMLDVGQGQAILLQTEGKTILVDCGGDSDNQTADLIADTLLSQGIHRLNAVIITHYDRDHSGALHNLLTRVDTDCLFLPDTQNEMEPPETTGDIFYVWEDVELTVGNAQVQIYGPVYSGYDNENSLCVLFDTEKCDILITGDRSAFGERMLLRQRCLPDVDILVAGHHGAESSSSEELFEAITPETVLISVGQDNIYGHPADTLLQRAEKYGCTVYRTDIHGTIVIRR